MATFKNLITLSSGNTSPISSLPSLASSATYLIHPLVIVSILDHYKRRHQHNHRVIGTLLGERIGEQIHVKNCFPVPHNEEEDTVAVDMDYHNHMYNLHRQSHPRDVVVGWYSTGLGIKYVTSLIHQAYRTHVTKVSALPTTITSTQPNTLTSSTVTAEQSTQQTEPLLLTINTDISLQSLPMIGYVEKVVNVNGAEVLGRFERVQTQLYCADEEGLGLDALLTGKPDPAAGNRLDAPSTLTNENEQIMHALYQLLASTETCSSYVDRVISGEIVGDSDIAGALHNALTAVPMIDAQSCVDLLNGHVQDLLAILYLAQLTKPNFAFAYNKNSTPPA
jgi:translation initiation factor 3 subunit F